MKILITAATQAEFKPAMEALKAIPNADIECHITGIGMLATGVALTKLVLQKQPDLVIQVGIAGTFTIKIAKGQHSYDLLYTLPD